MPIYEYRCKRCGHVTSFLESFNTQGPHECDECGSRATKRVLSTFAAQVKGGSPSVSSCPTGTCPLSS